MTKSMTHSFSRISAFLRCARAFRFQYRDGMGNNGSPAADLGSVCHHFFEAYVKALDGRGLAQDLALAEKVMGDVFFSQKSPVAPELYDEYVAICRTFARKYRHNKETFVAAEMEIAVTRELAVCAWDAPEAWFRFKIDRLDRVGDRLMVTDYKTGWGGDADPFQFLLYAVAVLTWWRVTRPSEIDRISGVDVSAHYARKDLIVPRRFGNDEIARGLTMMRGYADQLEREEEFRPTPGAACRGCNFAAICPARARNIVDLNDPETAERVAEESLLLRAQARAREDALRAWVSGHGPVAARGMEYTFSSAEKLRVSDPVSFMRVVEASGHDSERIYNGGTRAIRSACRRDPVLAHNVSQFVDAEVTERFGVRKAA